MIAKLFEFEAFAPPVFTSDGFFWARVRDGIRTHDP